MKFEKTKVFNFEGALRGMRNPKESWDRSDSFFGFIDIESADIDYTIANYWAQLKYPGYQFLGEDNPDAEKLVYKCDEWLIKNGILEIDPHGSHALAALIGPNDMRLAQTLIRAGSEHRKFMRQILVSVDITAPLYWWKEFDTYKVGTVANSTSTMHKLATTPITLDCFEIDDLNIDVIEHLNDRGMISISEIIDFCESLRLKYLETKDKAVWKELIRWLPDSWLQKRTITFNYENLFTMHNHRENHKLTEWAESFINWEKTLPYANELIFIEKKEN